MRSAPHLSQRNTMCLIVTLFFAIKAMGNETRSPSSPWDLEDERLRQILPEYLVIPGASPDSLTPALPIAESMSRNVWNRSHGGYHNWRYSESAQINPENIQNLRVKWTYKSGDGNANIQCNPVYGGGMIYVPTPGNYVVALNAATGAEIWRYKPDGRPAHRGITWIPGDHSIPPMIYFNSGDYLYCLDAEKGIPFSGFAGTGYIRTPVSVIAPAIYLNKILIAGIDGNAYAYDRSSGDLLWTFNTIPGGHTGTADSNWGDNRQGANCWGGSALDISRSIFYISTGSPKPNFIGVDHHGKNLYANCVVAIDADTGEKLWHFQEIRHDIWDLDIPAPPNLLSITRNGKRVDVVSCVTKLGNTLLLDRVTGKPIFDFRLRRAPISRLPGEKTWPYQPAPELPEPFSRQIFNIDDIYSIDDRTRAFINNRIHNTETGLLSNFGWFQTFNADHPTIFYGIHGGAEWTGASVDPVSGHLFVTSNEIPWIQTVQYLPSPSEKKESESEEISNGIQKFNQLCAPCHGQDLLGKATSPPLIGLGYRLNMESFIDIIKNGKNLMPAFPELTNSDTEELWNYLIAGHNSEYTVTSSPKYTFMGYTKLLDQNGYPGTKPPWGTLNCLDLNTGKLMWQVPFGEYAELTRTGIPLTGTENFGGASNTAGNLVFATGTRDKKIRAFHKQSGDELWQAELPFTGSAPPSVFIHEGQQLVVVPATGGGKLGDESGDCFVCFALSE